jgi:L-alanine-DL-glutamate epimerase-like enolase superfamily enzyme
MATLGRAETALAGLRASDITELLQGAASVCAGHPAALAGLEMALFDLWGKTQGIGLRQHFGGRSNQLVTDMTIPIVSAAEAETSARDLFSLGFAALKIKVGDPAGLEADWARIEAVRRGAPTARLRLDANQGLTTDSAARLIERLERAGAPVDLIEQPVAKHDHAGLRAIRELSPYPVFADESACTPSDVRRLLESKAVDGVVVKLMKSGLSGALEILDLCAQSGTKTMMGCMLESGLGIAAALAITLGRGTVEFADLDSHQLLAPIGSLDVPFDCDADRLIWNRDAPGWGVSFRNE